jgi:hypothetical protein
MEVVRFEIGNRLLSSVEIDHVTVKPFDGYIFLCGGALNGSAEAFASAREYSLKKCDERGRIAGREVKLAERMTALLEGEEFEDLLQFEEHIAAISACVLIFVESPGSIAELGSFSVMPDLAQKLLVVCEQRFETGERKGFIFLGPIANLRRRRNESVQIFPIFEYVDGAWQPDREKLDDCWEFIQEAVVQALHRPIPEAAFNPKNLAHRMMAVATTIDLSVAIKIGEIEEFIAAIGITESAKALRRILRTLEQIGLIESRTYGNERFYHALLSQPLMGFRLKGAIRDELFDSVRFKADVIAYYESNDARRAKAIKAFLRDKRHGD